MDFSLPINYTLTSTTSLFYRSKMKVTKINLIQYDLNCSETQVLCIGLISLLDSIRKFRIISYEQ